MPKMLTIKEVCERLSANRWSVWKLINSGALASVDIGTSKKRKLIRVPETALEDFVANRTSQVAV